jgi:hypothetical protein
VISPLTSARKRAIVSMLTDTSTVASSSRISGNDAPLFAQLDDAIFQRHQTLRNASVAEA